MFETLFGSRTRVKILKLFLVDTSGKKTFYVREICRRIQEHLNSVRRELENLRKMGLLTARQKNRKKFWRLNTDFIFLSELRALFTKSNLLVEGVLAGKLRELGRPRLLVLTGFFTDTKNPTDVLVVGRLNRKKLAKVMKRFEKKLARSINYTIMSTKEFKMRRELTDRFLFNILENKKIVLINELGI